MTPSPHAKDTLDRAGQIENFTTIVTGEHDYRVLSIEAGYGEGKTWFAAELRDRLEKTGEKVVLFDAWKTDTGGDPMIAFLAELERARPKEKTDRSVARVGGKILGKVGYHVADVAWKAVVRESVSDSIDRFNDVAETSVDGETIASDLANGLSKAFAAAISSQAKRQSELEGSRAGALDAIREAMGVEERKRLYVIIDELDRCRPDYAISLLEGIKHLFDHEGYRFALMINPQRLEATAATLFGKIETGEPYFTKFIDLRLSLGAGSLERLIAERLAAFKPQRPLFEHSDWGEREAEERAERLGLVARHFGLSARAVERSFSKATVAASLAGDAPFETTILLALAFCEYAAPSAPPSTGLSTDRTRYARVLQPEPPLSDWLEKRNEEFDEIVRKELFKTCTHRQSAETEYSNYEKHWWNNTDIWCGCGRYGRGDHRIAKKASDYSELGISSASNIRSAIVDHHIAILDMAKGALVE